MIIIKTHDSPNREQIKWLRICSFMRKMSAKACYVMEHVHCTDIEFCTSIGLDKGIILLISVTWQKTIMYIVRHIFHQ